MRIEEEKYNIKQQAMLILKKAAALQANRECLKNPIQRISVPISLINTPWAETALWKMAEYLPVILLSMSEEEPKELYNLITGKVEKALAWEKTAISKGADKDEAREIMIDLLNPSYQPENPDPLVITEEQMSVIYQKLKAIEQEEE